MWQVNPTLEEDDSQLTAPFVKVLRLNDPLVGGTKLTETYSNGIAFDQNTNFLYFFYKTPDSESAAANGIERVPGREETLKEPGCMGSEDKCEFNIVWWDFGSYLAEPDDPPIWNWLRWPKEEEPKGFVTLRDKPIVLRMLHFMVIRSGILLMADLLSTS